MALIRTVQNVVEQRRTNRHAQVMRFPEDLGSHAVILNFKEYDYSQTDGGESLKTSRSIVLPLPSNLQDSFSVNANSQELGVGGDFLSSFLGSTNGAAELGEKAANGAISTFQDAFSESGADNLSTFKAASRFISRAGLDSVAPGVGAAIDVASGKAVNPHVTIDFDGMALKQHSFTWNLAPKNERESASLRKITNEIRKSILPQYNGGTGSETVDRALITYPDLVDIFFVGIDQSYFYYFKPCIVQNFSTDFSPNGLAFVRGGRPATVQIQMQLSEAQIHTREDYSEAQTFGGGF